MGEARNRGPLRGWDSAVPVRKCPACGVEPFAAFLRGQIGRPSFPWWAWFLPLERWRRPHLAIICWTCKEIVGWEW